MPNVRHSGRWHRVFGLVVFSRSPLGLSPLDFSDGLENERTGRLRWVNLRPERMLVGMKAAGRVDFAPDGRSMLTTTAAADRRAHPKRCGLLAPPEEVTSD